MLVLSRKKNEGIRINEDIRLVVVEIHGDKVRLGIDAPEDVPVNREEIWQKIVAAGGHWRYAHLFDGAAYLGPVKCASKKLAERARQTHTEANPSHWGMVTASEERPEVDRSIQVG